MYIINSLGHISYTPKEPSMGRISCKPKEPRLWGVGSPSRPIKFGPIPLWFSLMVSKGFPTRPWFPLRDPLRVKGSQGEYGATQRQNLATVGLFQGEGHVRAGLGVF